MQNHNIFVVKLHFNSIIKTSPSKMKNVLLFFVLPCFFAHCIKQETAPTKTDLITAVPYKIVSESIDGQPIQVKECEKDNLLSFDKSGVVTIADGANQCTGNSEGTWAFMSHETEIKFAFSGSIFIQKIIRLDSDFLVLRDEKNVQTTYTNQF